MGKATHSIGLTAIVSMPEQWDALYKRFTEIMREFSDTIPGLNINSYLINDEDGIDEQTEYYDEFTLFKVVAAFQAAGIEDSVAEQVIQEMQNRGILFRERRRPQSEDNLS